MSGDGVADVISQALRLFERAMAGDALAGYARLVSRIGDMISALPPPPSSAPPPKVSELPKTPRGPRVWPIPGAVPVLSRPHPGPLSGRRQVPKLVNASGIPILRLKKPQSPYLSRIIRNKKEDFQKKVTQLIELQNHLEKVRLEDRWDLIVRDVCGRSEVDGDEENEPLWAFEVVLTMRDINRKLRKEKEARAQTAKKMYEIVVEERRLAEAEKLQRIREKKLARRLAKAEEAMQAASLG